MANKYLILLVEDESNIASFITTVLRANQYEVKRAATGHAPFRSGFVKSKAEGLSRISYDDRSLA